MDSSPDDEVDPRAEIVRLEALVEQLAAKVESCRKFILAGRLAISLGAIVFAALLVGAVRFDVTVLFAAIAAVLCGVVMWGSNSSTEKEARTHMAAAEERRAELISRIELRLVSDRPTLH